MDAIGRVRYQIGLLRDAIDRATAMMDSPLISQNLFKNLEYEIKATKSLLDDKVKELELLYEVSYEQFIDALSGSDL